MDSQSTEELLTEALAISSKAKAKLKQAEVEAESKLEPLRKETQDAVARVNQLIWQFQKESDSEDEPATFKTKVKKQGQPRKVSIEGKLSQIRGTSRSKAIAAGLSPKEADKKAELAVEHYRASDKFKMAFGTQANELPEEFEAGPVLTESAAEGKKAKKAGR